MTVAEIAADARACCRRRRRRHPSPRPRRRGTPHASTPTSTATRSPPCAAQPGRNSIIQVTTEAVGRFSPAEQMAMRPRGEARGRVDRAPRTCPGRGVRGGGAGCSSGGWPEHASRLSSSSTSPTEVTRLLDLIDRGVIPFARPFLLFVLGRYAADQQSLAGGARPVRRRPRRPRLPLGDAAPSAVAKPNARSTRPVSAAMSASASRTTSICRTVPSRRQRRPRRGHRRPPPRRGLRHHGCGRGACADGYRRVTPRPAALGGGAGGDLRLHLSPPTET